MTHILHASGSEIGLEIVLYTEINSDPILLVKLKQIVSIVKRYR